MYFAWSNIKIYVFERAGGAKTFGYTASVDGAKVSLKDVRGLVDGLNALGVGPRDIISILQAIKASGALQADIQIIG